MPENVKNRRRYTSSRRREQAEETRRRILDAAQDLFLTHGYTAATIESIANDAQVAAQTVYAGFGNKRGSSSPSLSAQSVETISRSGCLNVRIR